MPSKSSLDAVFKFSIHRPPVHAEALQLPDINRATDFQNELREAIEDQDRNRYNLAQYAEEYKKSDSFVNNLAVLDNGDALLHAVTLLHGPSSPPMPLSEIVGTAFGTGIDTLSTNNSIQSDFDRLSDSVIALKFSSGSIDLVKDLQDGLRVLAAIDVPELHDKPAPTIQKQTLVFGDAVVEKIVEMSRPEAVIADPPKIDKTEKYNVAIAELKRLDAQKNYVPATKKEQPVSESIVGTTPNTGGVFDRWLGSIGKKKVSSRASIDPFVLIELDFVPFVLIESAVEQLSEETKEFIDEEGLEVRTVSLPLIVNKMEERRDRAQVEKERVDVGAIIRESHLHRSIPTSKGRVAPNGIADLLVVRQQIKRYEGGEVAHVENVLRGETKDREHRRLEKRETTSLRETEVTSEVERELESTERFEMQTETSKTITRDAQARAGLTISGSYGPSVSFTASAEGSIAQSEQESKNASTSYAKDVVDRSLSRIVERNKESRTTKILHETEELNSHTISAPGDKPHISGVYQWVDKVYEAQVMNYGKRLLFDFVIPEPASLLWHLITQPSAPAPLPEVIEKFTTKPDEVSAGNYPRFVALYGATGVEPPPKEYEFVSKSIASPKNEDTEDPVITLRDSIGIPVGYEAQSFSAKGSATGLEDVTPKNFTLVVGDTKRFANASGALSEEFVEFSHSTLVSDDDGITSSVPIAIASWGWDAFAMTVLIKCIKTDYAFEKWQNDTYQRIREAYEQRLADWEAKVDAILDNQSVGIEIKGRNPAKNREIERNELKRASIELLTEQRFGLFNATHQPRNGFPYINFQEADEEGQYIRFFEHAFEWEQLTYSLYPYFWGRKTNWVDRLLTHDLDPLHEQFLKAGAARVVVPVRPGYQKAVIHFLDTGVTWNGVGSPPDVTSPQYVSIVQEFKESSGNFDNEKPVGEPWEVTVPTSLVKLRPDDKLPEWAKNTEGNWVPVEGSD